LSEEEVGGWLAGCAGGLGTAVTAAVAAGQAFVVFDVEVVEAGCGVYANVVDFHHSFRAIC
jgi:hypothetical protein